MTELSRRRFLVHAAMAPAFGLAATPSLAQTAASYPSKPIRVLVPFAPGGGQDEFARRFLPMVGSDIGKRIIIDNRPGGNTVLATELAARATPDGYTLLQQTSSFTANPALLKQLSYDSLRDFKPIALAARTPHVLIVNNDLPVKTIGDLVAYAKAQPKRLNYGSGGIGSTNHIAALMFIKETGVAMEHIVYRGATEFNNDLLGGRIDLVFGGSAQSAAMAGAGSVRALGTTSANRIASLPDVPTFREAGLNLEIYSWTGYLAPAKTSDEIVSKLAAAMQAACGDPKVREAFPAHELIGAGPTEFGAFLKDEIGRVAELLKDIRS